MYVRECFILWCMADIPKVYNRGIRDILCMADIPKVYNRGSRDILCMADIHKVYNRGIRDILCMADIHKVYNRRSGDILCMADIPKVYSRRSWDILYVIGSPYSYSRGNGDISCMADIPIVYNEKKTIMVGTWYSTDMNYTWLKNKLPPDHEYIITHHESFLPWLVWYKVQKAQIRRVMCVPAVVQCPLWTLCPLWMVDRETRELLMRQFPGQTRQKHESCFYLYSEK